MAKYNPFEPDNEDGPIFNGPHHHPGRQPPHPPLHPHMREIVKVVFDDEARNKLEETYGDALKYVFDVINHAPAEGKLTLAILLGLKVDLSACTQYVTKAVKFPSPLLSETAKKALGKILGEGNIENALYIYNASPAEQVMIAVTIAMMMQDQYDVPETGEKEKGEPQDGLTKDNS